MKSNYLLVVFALLSGISLMAQDLKVVSFNIRYRNLTDGNDIWDLRKESAGDFIVFEYPDFFGLQEAVLSQIEDVEDRTKGYKWIGSGRDDGEQGGEYTPLFYLKKKWKLLDSDTFWLSETPDIPSKSWDTTYPRICTWGRFRNRKTDKIILVLNTHFDHIGEVSRLNASNMILEKTKELKSQESVILMGDFNAEPESEPIKNLSSNWNDSYEKASIRYGEKGTFNGFNINEIPKRRIDYVFVGNQLKVKKYTVDSRIIDGRFLSDHFPVIVELELK